MAAAAVLLSRWPGTSMPGFHYWAPMYPLAVSGAIVALGDPDRPKLVRPALVAVGGAAALALMSPLSPRAPGPGSVRSPPEFRHDRADAVAEADIGPDESVVATSAILAHLTHRQEAWLFPAPWAGAGPAALAPPRRRAAAGRAGGVIGEGEAGAGARRYGLLGDVEEEILTARP